MIATNLEVGQENVLIVKSQAIMLETVQKEVTKRKKVE